MKYLADISVLYFNSQDGIKAHGINQRAKLHSTYLCITVKLFVTHYCYSYYYYLTAKLLLVILILNKQI